jgi:hypothetical protein
VWQAIRRRRRLPRPRKDFRQIGDGVTSHGKRQLRLAFRAVVDASHYQGEGMPRTRRRWYKVSLIAMRSRVSSDHKMKTI